MNYCLDHSPSDENLPTTNGSTQHSSNTAHSQTTNSIPNQIPSQNDPFSISKNRVNGEVKNNTGGLALFEKLNGAKNIATPVGIGGGLEFSGMDTPTAMSGIESDRTMKREAEAIGLNSHAPSQPPLAPLRRQRTMQGLGLDISTDAPPKMRSNTLRTKSRSKPESEETDGSSLSRASTINHGVGDRKRTVSGQIAYPAANAASNVLNPANPNDPVPPSRRSMRLFNKPTAKFAAVTGSLTSKEGRDLRKSKAPMTKGRSANALNVGRVVSGNRNFTEHGREVLPTTTTGQNPAAPAPKPQVSDRIREREALEWLLDLLARLGGGYFALAHYQTQNALQIFNSVTLFQRETPWVFAQIGRTLYEQGSYPEAEKYFILLRQKAPSRLQDMEVYSTILWHLKNDIELAFLAHELLALDRLSPQAWCAVGNSFSLQRDHDQALKCFKRATQLDPTFAYAFTLQGHEHVATEEYDKALSAYRAAIAAESRHYNAWYGLGRVYEKQGKYALAESHYRNAASINPTNAVLVCCIGVVLEKLKNPKAALVQYAKSVELAPKSALARFKKARVLMSLGELGGALQDLRILKDLAPDEANVHFLLGRCYKGLGERGMAIRYFTEALNLDPKVSAAQAVCSRSEGAGAPARRVTIDCGLTSGVSRHHSISKRQWSRWKTRWKTTRIRMTCTSRGSPGLRRSRRHQSMQSTSVVGTVLEKTPRSIACGVVFDGEQWLDDSFFVSPLGH